MTNKVRALLLIAGLVLLFVTRQVIRSQANVLQPHHYIAILTQSGYASPVATVLENDFDGELVWGRYNNGDYTVTLNGAFSAGASRTWMNVSKPTLATITSDDLIYRSDDDTLTLETQVDGVSSDGVLYNTAIEIRTYPEP